MQRGRRLIEDELEVHLLALVVPHYLDKPGGTTTLARRPLHTHPPLVMPASLVLNSQGKMLLKIKPQSALPQNACACLSP